MGLKTNGFFLANYAKGFGKIILDYFDFSLKEDYSLNTAITINRKLPNIPYQMDDIIEMIAFSHHINRNNNVYLK